MSAWWHVLGAPELTAEVRATIIRGCTNRLNPRSTHELAAQRDEILLGLLSLRRTEI